jgi:membrane protein YdbS with pleckstrin-like domain
MNAGMAVGAADGPGGRQAGDVAWERVLSRQLAWTQRVRTALLPIGLLVAAALSTGTPAASITLAAVGCCVFALLFGIAGRTARSWKFLERPDDLLIEHGVLLRRQVVVPYGRMQFVDIKIGPLERMLGIATLQLHTAAAASDARIPGLAPARAEQLRDLLAARGEARLAGL